MTPLQKKAIELSIEKLSNVNEYSFTDEAIERMSKYIDDKQRLAAVQMDLRNLFAKHITPIREANQWLNTIIKE